jgi:hypothetical protein
MYYYSFLLEIGVGRNNERWLPLQRGGRWTHPPAPGPVGEVHFRTRFVFKAVRVCVSHMPLAHPSAEQ